MCHRFLFIHLSIFSLRVTPGQLCKPSPGGRNKIQRGCCVFVQPNFSVVFKITKSCLAEINYFPMAKIGFIVTALVEFKADVRKLTRLQSQAFQAQAVAVLRNSSHGENIKGLYGIIFNAFYGTGIL